MDKLWAPWRMEYILNDIDKHDGCIFCDFPQAGDDSKYHIVHRSDTCFVILNKFPYNNGHLLVVPYRHCADMLQLEKAELTDLQQTLQKCVQVLRNAMHPHGMNIGLNLGRTAGAGIDEHIHYHIVPRWDGDTNFMPVLAGTKVISESLEASRDRLQAEFERLFGRKDGEDEPADKKHRAPVFASGRVSIWNG